MKLLFKKDLFLFVKHFKITGVTSGARMNLAIPGL